MVLWVLLDMDIGVGVVVAAVASMMICFRRRGGGWRTVLVVSGTNSGSEVG